MQSDASSSDAIAEAIQRQRLATAAANVAVNKCINEAVAWILSDPTEYFLYKYPRECEERPNNSLQVARIAAMKPYGASTSEKERRNSVRAVTKANERKRIDWLRIDEFSLHRVVQLVCDYLSLWRLTPDTQYMVRLKKNELCAQPQGRTYSLSALFTRQPQCDLEHCNPLAMAQINFKVHVSHLLPKFYPVMMTYRFENCNTDYYALGNRRMRRLDFQRFFIDMALETRLGFYAQLLKTLALSTTRRSGIKRRGSKRENTKEKEEEARAMELKATPTLHLCEAEDNAREMGKISNEEEQMGNVSENASNERFRAAFGVGKSCDSTKSANMSSK